MDKATANPFFVALMFFLRCLIPLLIMLGVSYLLRRFGFIAESPPPPADYEDENTQDNHNDTGDLAHGKL